VIWFCKGDTVKKRKDTEQVYARIRAAATADRLRRMIYEGVAFPDEIDDVAAAVQALAIDVSKPHLLTDLLHKMAHMNAADTMVPLNPKHCTYLAEAETKLEAFARI
jgi:hypothetical protein